MTNARAMKNSIPLASNIHRLCVCISMMALCSCSTLSTPQMVESLSVHKVDFSDAPEMKVFADRARQIGNEMYPKVCALLADGDSEFPRRFDISFKKRLPHGDSGETRITQICLNASYFNVLQDNPAAFDQMLIHEMAHVAQHYYRPLIGKWMTLNPHPPSCWEEGIADYIFFKLSQTNGWRCAECGLAFPHYRNGYSCAGAFLLYLDTYNPNLVRQLNTALRRGRYSDKFFADATGKGLPELWVEFQQTAAFTPNAKRMLELQQSLGYVDSKPPKDIERRFKAYVNQHTDAITKDLIKFAHVPGLSMGDIQARMAILLYFTQPGGAAEAYMDNLRNEQKVPGFSKEEHGTLIGFLRPGDLNSTFPLVRSFTATKQGDSSAYHYTVSRPSQESGWKLQRAWRTNSDGQVVEEYPVP